MIIFFVLISIAALWGIRYRRLDSLGINYLSKDATNAIKGIWILFVFLRHANQYVHNSGYVYSNFGDRLFLITDGLLQQLIVVMFLFFSGYGVYCSILRGGVKYINSIPKKRILGTLVNFDIAVVVYILVDLIVDEPLTMETILLSFSGWESVGNSNWYIFVILACYLTTYLSFIGFNQKSTLLPILFNGLLIVVVAILLLKSGKPQWWYDTILAYPLGMLFRLYKDKFDKFFSLASNYIIMLITAVICFVISYVPVYIFSIQIGAVEWIMWALRVTSLIMVTLLIMMKWEINNKFIVWLGLNLFPLYIYQRVPMILLSPYLANKPYMFFVVTFILSCLLVPIYKKIEVKLA